MTIGRIVQAGQTLNNFIQNDMKFTEIICVHSHGKRHDGFKPTDVQSNLLPRQDHNMRSDIIIKVHTQATVF